MKVAEGLRFRKPCPIGVCIVGDEPKKALRDPIGREGIEVATQDRRGKKLPYQSLLNVILASEMRKAS
jgi:hypothetical protein